MWGRAYCGLLLRIEMHEERCLIEYADDVVALVAYRSVDLAQLKLNRVIPNVSSWMAAHGLTLALNLSLIHI